MSDVLENEFHMGVLALGDEVSINDVENENLKNLIESEDEIIENRKRDCTVLYSNGVYEKPNILVTGGKVSVSLGRNVKKIQLRSVPGNGIRHFRGGTHSIPNGEYVLSLFGGTYPYPYIRACVSYR